MTFLGENAAMKHSAPNTPLAANPLLQDWTAPYGLPPFGQVRPEHFAPAFDIAMKAQLAELDAIANNAELGAVTFRWQGRWTTALRTDNWTHTLGINYKSGYADQLTTVEVLDAAGNVTGTEDIRLKVKDYLTADVQTQWRPRKDIAITLGILNLFNEDPPFSLSTGGVNKGQQFGYDDRYYDPRGRTYYINASYKF